MIGKPKRTANIVIAGVGGQGSILASHLLTIKEDQADVVVSMEPLEGLRVARTFLKPGGWALLNSRPWVPIDVAVGRAEYPSLERILDALSKLDARALTLDATDLALQAGNPRTANSVMLGGLFALGLLDLSEEHLFSAMAERWPDRLVQVNRRAYDLGYQAVAAALDGSLGTTA